MPNTRDLLRGPITYSEAKKKQTNILQELTYVTLAAKFRDHIEKESATVKRIIAHHLHLSLNSHDISISDRSEWINGSFNLCVPVSIQNQKRKCNKRVIIRFPLPYKTGESFRPGNGDEKIRCEAATYSWLNQECPSIPTACLQGFGLSTGQRFTILKNTPIWTRCIQYFKRKILSLFRYPVPCQYVRHQTSTVEDLGVGYLLLDYVEDGKMLSETYAEQMDDNSRRHNLFRDLAKIQLTLFQKPLPRIGSLTIDDDGIVSLTNRPLTLEVCHLENEKIPVKMPRDRTYSAMEAYANDTLSYHNDRLRHQLNGATSIQDCISQMSALSTMRTVYYEYFDPKLRSGPFVLSFTDMHTSNFFVDDNWHITKIIDLEWACSRPIEMQHPPYWMTDQAVDRIDEAQYSEMYDYFLDAFEKEERKAITDKSFEITTEQSYTELLKKLWEKGTFWYCLALNSPTGLHHVFYNRILPKYNAPKEPVMDSGLFIVAPTFWSVDSWDLVLSKKEDKEQYDEQIRCVFEEQ